MCWSFIAKLIGDHDGCSIFWLSFCHSFSISWTWLLLHQARKYCTVLDHDLVVFNTSQPYIVASKYIRRDSRSDQTSLACCCLLTHPGWQCRPPVSESLDSDLALGNRTANAKRFMGHVLQHVVDDSGHSISIDSISGLTVVGSYSRRTPYFFATEKGWRQKGKETIVYLRLSLRSIIRWDGSKKHKSSLPTPS